MAYHIEGEKKHVVYCANPRTGSTALASTLMNMGAQQENGHHGQPLSVPPDALVVETVRHHCDVLVSYWYQKASAHQFEDFVDMVLAGEVAWLNPNAFYDKFDTNYILRYETLQYEFDNLCLNAGLPETKLLVKPSKRPRNMKWGTMFPTRLLNKVFDRYGEELERLGYGRR